MRYTGAFLTWLLILQAVPAAAQFTPFMFDNRYGQRLSSGDWDLMLSSINTLNRGMQVEVGSANKWNNPRTGSRGTTSVTQIVRQNGMICHLLRHQVSIRGSMPLRVYDLKWCLTPDGAWKVAG